MVGDIENFQNYIAIAGDCFVVPPRNDKTRVNDYSDPDGGQDLLFSNNNCHRGEGHDLPEITAAIVDDIENF